MRYEDIKALNWSSLSAMAESPLLYRWRTEHPRPDTTALSMGRAIHEAVLEPDLFAEHYVARPNGLDLRTVTGKTWKAENADRTILSADEAETIRRCVAAIAAHGPASALLADTDREVTMRWELDGVGCKGRADALNRQELVDLKTTRDLGRFPRDAARYRYHGQMAWYRDGAVRAGLLDEDAEVYLVVVETAEPYDVAVFHLSEAYYLSPGRALYERLLGLWQQCDRTGIWPGRYPAVTELDLPDWALERDEEF